MSTTIPTELKACFDAQIQAKQAKCCWDWKGGSFDKAPKIQSWVLSGRPEMISLHIQSRSVLAV